MLRKDTSSYRKGQHYFVSNVYINNDLTHHQQEKSRLRWAAFRDAKQREALPFVKKVNCILIIMFIN